MSSKLSKRRKSSVSSLSELSELSDSKFDSSDSDTERIKTVKKIRKNRKKKLKELKAKNKNELVDIPWEYREENLNRENKMDVTHGSGSAKRYPQYLAALSVCLGSVAAGAVLGWTSNITDALRGSQLNDISVDTDVLGWISSSTSLGAMFVCFPIGIICDMIGRKWACLSTIIPFSIGWLLIIFANGPMMIYVGRFLTGVAGGAFCVAAPIYTSEIAQKEIRGTLGSYFQLLLTVGILFSYLFGSICSPKVLSILCACIPLVFGVIFFFQPETPIYCLKKGDKNAALHSMRRLRGDQYDCESELHDIQVQLDKDAALNVPFFEAIRTHAAKKALFICFGLMFFQQMSGVNAVIFYTGTIFEAAGGTIRADYATIGIGIVQTISTFISTMVVDKFGRKILLILSALFMGVAGALLGIFFTLTDRHVVDEDTANNIGFLPIVSLVIFISMFSLGFGPIPWMASAEIMPPEIKSTAVSAAATFNWFLAFIVTRFYNNLTDVIGGDSTFYIFAGLILFGCFFVYILVPETKGKSIQEVQDILNGHTSGNKSNGIENPSFKS